MRSAQLLIGASIPRLTTSARLAGGWWTAAAAIDNYGQVVGSSWINSDDTYHAFVYSNGMMQDLNNLASAGSCDLISTASGINDRGQIAANANCMGQGRCCFSLDPIYNAPVRPPVSVDGSSVFAVKRESVPLAFILTQRGTRTCTLLPARLAITRITGGKLTRVRSRNLSTTGCRYAYDLKPNRLGVGMYRADVSINGIMVGHAVFAVK